MGGMATAKGAFFVPRERVRRFGVSRANGGGAVRHGTPIALIYKDGGWARAQRVKGANSGHFWAWRSAAMLGLCQDRMDGMRTGTT